MKRLAFLTAVTLGSALVPLQVVQAAPGGGGPPACRPESPTITEEVDKTTHFADGTHAIYDGNEGVLTSLLGYGLFDDFSGGTATIDLVLMNTCRGAEYRMDVFSDATASTLLGTASYVSDGRDATPQLVIEVPDTHQTNCVHVQGVATYRDAVLDQTEVEEVCDTGAGGGRTMF
jgi:hypothetical protein